MEKSDFESVKDYWVFHVENFKKTGGKAVDYCKKYNINKKSFSAQKSVLKKSSSISPSAKLQSSFISLTDIEVSAELKTIKLVILGTELVFNKEPEPKWLAQVLLELRRYSYV
jgi:hypothetical protein